MTNRKFKKYRPLSDVDGTRIPLGLLLEIDASLHNTCVNTRRSRRFFVTITTVPSQQIHGQHRLEDGDAEPMVSHRSTAYHCFV